RILTRCVLFESLSTIRIRRVSLLADLRTDLRGGESPRVREKKTVSVVSMIEECALSSAICHVLSQVTNHAPSKPIRTPSSGLDTANQNGIISLSGIAWRLTLPIRKLVFMSQSLFVRVARCDCACVGFFIAPSEPITAPSPG